MPKSSGQRARGHYIHQLSYSAQEKLVGVFVLGGLGLIVLLLILSRQQWGLFESPLRIQLQVMSAEGLARDTPVRISGIQVGRIESIELNDQHQLVLTARIQEQYRRLVRADSQVSLGKLSLLGRSSIEITPGSLDQPELPEGTLLLVAPNASIDELLSQVEPVLHAMEVTIQNLARITSAIEPQRLSQTLEQVELISHDLRQITQGIAAGEGLVGQLLQSQDLQQGVERSLEQLEASLASLEQRLEETQPLLAAATQLAVQGEQLLPSLPPLVDESQRLVEQVNQTLSIVNQQMDRLPLWADQIQVLMQESEQLLEALNHTWPLSRHQPSRRPPASQRPLEVQPYD